MGASKIIKIIILTLFLAVTGYYLLKYLAKGSSFFASLTGSAGEKVVHALDRSLEFVGMGGKDIGEKIEEEIAPERVSTLSQPINEGTLLQMPEPLPDSYATSMIQTGVQKGYCYIGTDRGIRSCISINDQDSCLSGDIFPSKSTCLYPQLRQTQTPPPQYYYYQNGQYYLNSPYNNTFNSNYYLNNNNNNTYYDNTINTNVHRGYPNRPVQPLRENTPLDRALDADL